MLDDDRADELGGLVGLALHGHPLKDVLELHAPGLLGQDGNVVRIPLHKTLALLDLAALGHRDHGADHHRVTLQLAAVLGVDADKPILVQHDVVPLKGFHRAEVGVLDRTVVLRLDLRLLEHLGGRTSDVERPHGQLGAGLTDRLGGDNADRLAELGGLVGGKILPIAGGADAALGLASQGRTDLHPLHAEGLDGNGGLLADDFTGGDHLLFADRIDDVVNGGPAINPVAEADDLIVPFQDRFHPDPPLRAAIRLTNDDIHGHVAKLAGHVA